MDRLTATNRLNDGGRLLVENPQAADLDVPLTNSIIPQRGVGAVSYTRATIATVTDHEWVIRNCIAGEARFQWARRVRNLTPYSQEANISWNKFNVTVSGTKVAYTDGSLIGQTIVSAAASAVHYISNGTWPVIIWNTYLFSVSVKAAWVNFVQLAFAASTTYQNFDLTNGSMTGTAGAGSVVDEWNGWYRCTVKFVSTLGTNAGQGIVIVSSMGDARLLANLWDGVSGISVCRMQLEDVTGQSIQTPSEYVSTNVLTTAPYHGSNVDGVKCFKTTLAWLPISPSTLKGFLCEWARTNICNYSNIAVAWWGLVACARNDNAWIAPDGTKSMVKIIPNVGSNGVYAYNLNITTAASVYTVSCYVKAAWFNFVQLRFGAGISSGLANFDLLNWVVGTRSIWTSSGIEPVAAFPWVYRIWAVTNTVLAATAAIAIQIVPAANSVAGAAVTGDWVSGIMAWGMQIELWSITSTYIPTTTTTVTRNIDVLTYDVKNAIANQWALSVVSTMNDNEIFDRRALNLSSFTVNRLHIQLRTLWIPNVGIIYWDGVTVRSVIGVAAWTNNIAASWKNWVWLNLYMNNIKYIGAFVPSLAFTIIDVGGGVLWYPIFWCTKNLRIWKTVPTDAELLSLSNQS
jgi:hypothetical protein